jgi:histidinol-phosphate aminotransferase
MVKKNLANWFRPAILKMKGYTPGEQPSDPKVIKLNTNENPYAPPAAVLKAFHYFADERLRLYPEPSADTLRNALAETYDWPVEGVLVGNGSDEILSILFAASVGKGDLVQYPDLTYSLYPVLAQIREAKTKEVKLTPTFDLSFEKLSPNARLTFFGYPNPPIGNCYALGEIEAFVSKAKGLVVIDEAYVDFADTSCLELARRYSNVLILRTMSKSFSLAGVRLGYVFAHPDVVEQLMKVKDSYNVNRMTQAVGLAALTPESLETVHKNVKKIRFERDGLTEALRNMGFSVPDSHANFVLATRASNPSAESLYKNLKNKGVLIRYFSHPRLKHSLRITIGTPEQNHKLLASLKAALSSK